MTRPAQRTTISAPFVPDTGWLRSFRQRLLRWFAAHARPLPWRATRDPYAIWVSEIMLQQTQVETVIPYYARFLARFPTIGALAAAAEQDVLRHWEGLGYYRRARQMHKAAQVMVAEHHGQFPQDPQAVADLPGIGRYTAGAVLSIAWDLRQPILEANTLRLFSRLIGYAQDPTKADGQRQLWDFATRILPRKQCGAMNQAVMELGSLICRPKDPGCPRCPVAGLCAAYRDGLQHDIPVAAKRPQFEDLHEVALVVHKPGHVLLRQCQPGERWAGLWDYPRVPHPADPMPGASAAIIGLVLEQTGVRPHGTFEHMTTIRHGVTRYRIKLDCYLTGVDATGPRRRQPHARWVRLDALDTYPLSSTGRKISRLVERRELA